MATIGLAVAASHTPGLTGWFGKASEEDQQTVRSAFDAIHDAIAASNLDLLLLVGNDHVANSRVNDVPDFTFGLCERHRGPDAWFKPWLKIDDYDIPGDPVSGDLLYQAVKDGKLDVRAKHENLRFDDNLSVPVAMANLDAIGIPVVPILQNCTVPPVPGEHACYEFGRRLGDAIRDRLPADMRVGIIGSGGLSHEPGGARYLEIDEKFDRWFMDLLEEGDHQRILAEATFDRMEAAGSGGTAELLSWIVVMGAIGTRDCTSLGYVAFEEWRCGVGAVRWDVA